MMFSRLSVVAIPALALWALRDARDWERLLANLWAWVDAVDEALSSPHGVRAVAQVLRYVALVAGDVRFEEFRATIIREIPQAREVAMTIAEELRQEGRAEGRQEGRAEGRQEGRQEGRAEGRQEGRAEGRQETLVKMLVKQLTLKFGEPSTAQMARIEAASEAELEHCVERILTAETIEAVLAPR